MATDTESYIQADGFNKQKMGHRNMKVHWNSERCFQEN